MRIKLRLKGNQDADLLALKACNEFNFEGVLKRSIASFVRGEEFKAQTPICFPSDVPELTYVNTTISDKLSEEFLLSIKDGLRSTAIKSILRNCLSRPFVEGFAGSMTVKKSSPTPPKAQKIKEPAVKKEDKKEIGQTEEIPISQNAQTENIENDVDFTSLVENF